METKPKTIIIRITQEQHEWLMRRVQESGRTISEIIRDMLIEYLENKEGE